MYAIESKRAALDEQFNTSSSISCSEFLPKKKGVVWQFETINYHGDFLIEKSKLTDSDETTTHSITNAIIELGEHDEESARLLWNRFFERLAKFADGKVFPRHARFYDGEDVAASALFAVLDGIQHDRFERPENREDLWSLLVVVASRKAINRGKHLDAQRRDERRTQRGGSAFVPHGVGNLVDYLKSENDPATMYEFEATCKTMLNQLPDDSYRRVALLRMAGYTNIEIAKELDCATRTVERKLVAIRKLWVRLTDL